jgi:hypothetical protein
MGHMFENNLILYTYLFTYLLNYLLTHGAEPFLRRSQICSYSTISQHFMEPEGSLPCSQKPSTGPYPEPDQSNPYHPILSILILSTHLRLTLPSGLLPSAFPTNILYAFFFYPIRATCPGILTLLDHSNYTWRRVQVLSLRLSSVKISSSAPCSQAPSVYVPPLMRETKFHSHTEPQAKLEFCVF